MLGGVITTDCAIDEGTGEGSCVGNVEEVGDVKGRGGLAVEDADCPALFGEASVPGANVALGVGVHVLEATVPEEPDVFLVCDRSRTEKILVNFRIRA